MAQKKPQGFWDDIVYPIASKAMKKAVKSGKMKNTTRVKANRKIIDRAYIANRANKAAGKPKAQVRLDMQKGRENVKNANRVEKAIRTNEIARSVKDSPGMGLYNSIMKRKAVQKGAGVRSAKTGVKGRPKNDFGVYYGSTPRSRFQSDISAKQSPKAKAKRAAERKESAKVGGAVVGTLGAAGAASYGAAKGLYGASGGSRKTVKKKPSSRGGSSRKR